MQLNQAEKYFVNIKYLYKHIEQITMDIIKDYEKQDIQELRPTHIEPIVKSFNIAIDYIEMNKEISGQISIDETDGSCLILINKSHSHTRQNFTLAHEFGHYISYKFNKKSGSRTDYVDGRVSVFNKNRDKESELGIDLEEVFANNFAAAILMPKQLIQKAFETIKDIDHADEKLQYLAEKFGVSKLAMQYRILNLGL